MRLSNGFYQPMWTLLQPIQGVAAGQIVSEKKLLDDGYHVPNPTGWKSDDFFDPDNLLVT